MTTQHVVRMLGTIVLDTPTRTLPPMLLAVRLLYTTRTQPTPTMLLTVHLALPTSTVTTRMSPTLRLQHPTRTLLPVHTTQITLSTTHTDRTVRRTLTLPSSTLTQILHFITHHPDLYYLVI